MPTLWVPIVAKPETTGIDDIDFDFIRKLSAECPAKIIAEGHIHYPEQAVKALGAGAFALVVGGAVPAWQRSPHALPVPSTPQRNNTGECLL